MRAMATVMCVRRLTVIELRTPTVAWPLTSVFARSGAISAGASAFITADGTNLVTGVARAVTALPVGLTVNRAAVLDCQLSRYMNNLEHRSNSWCCLCVVSLLLGQLEAVYVINSRHVTVRGEAVVAFSGVY